MTTRAKRKSVPLTEHHLDIVQRIRQGNTLEATAFCKLTGVGPEAVPLVSESEIVKAIVHLGCSAIAERTKKESYERLAEFLKTDPEHRAWRASRNARRARRITQRGEV
jgi:hypothetical protein